MITTKLQLRCTWNTKILE